MGNCHHRKAYSSQDFIIKCPVEEIARQFFGDYIVVWHAVNVDSPQNQQILSQIEKFCYVKTFTEWERASAFILRTKKKCYVITSGENGESLVKEICSKENVLGIYIYCKNKDFHFEWAQKYPKTADLEKYAGMSVDQVKEKLLKWYKGQDFETRFPVFIPVGKAEMSPLRVAVCFKNRVEAKNDLLCLARTIYSDDQSAAVIDSFEENEYSPKDILGNWWPDKKSFLYRITQSCLRVGDLDSLDYCRLVIRDMEQAIKEEKNEDFKNGLVLYKGIEVADEEEWLRWKENLDGEIEVQGFLSASKEKVPALEWIKKEENKRVMITIIMPKGPNEVRNEQGFILKEEEGEVMFNIRSRFTVLEIEDLPGSKRHIVLLYGAEGFRRFVSQKHPVQEVSIPKGKISCIMCQDEVCGEKMFYLSLEDGKNSCQKCLKKFLKKEGKNGPLLCIPAGLAGKGYKTKLKGFMMKNSSGSKIPFYGYKCYKCQVKKPEKSFYYKCAECCQVWCGDCVESISECMKSKHNLILESTPFSFWCEKDENIKGKTLDTFQQAENYFNKDRNSKAMEYYKLYLRQNNIKKVNSATACQNLGIIYDNQREYLRALGYFFKALEIKESVYGENHTDVASTLNKIGLVYWRQGENKKALEFCSKALEIWRVAHGEKHIDVASGFNNIGLAYNGKKEYAKALEYYFKAVEIRNGEKSSGLATIYRNIAVTFEEQDDDMKALEYYSKALEIRKLVHGENHADVAISYCDLGRISSRQKEELKALEYYLKALEIRKLVYGENHADVADSVNIGTIYFQQKEYSKALEHCSKALEIRKFVYGEDHADVALCCNRIGQIYDSQKEHNLALEYYSRALEIGLFLYGKKHANVATYYNNIGHVYKSLKRPEKALESHLKALEIRKSLYGEVHWSVASSYHNLGVLSFWQQAIDYHLKALEINERIYGENSLKVADSCDHVGVTYFNQRKWKKSIQYYLRALEIREGIYEEEKDNCEIAWSCQNLGTVLYYKGENKKALEYCVRTRKIRKLIYGNVHPEIVSIEDLIKRINKAIVR